MRKIIGIFIVMLLISTVLPVLGITNTGNNIKSNESEKTSNDIFWSDDFDSYDLGQELDGTSDDGGWILYDDGSDPPAGSGTIVNDYFYSEPHSLEIYGQTDILHEFTGLNSGSWTYTERLYVPEIYTDGSFIYLGSYYWPGRMISSRWHLGIGISGTSDVIYDYYGGGEKYLPLITNQWIELRVEIDLEQNWCECYYNGDLLVDGIWTEMGFGDGYHNFGGVDLCWGNGPIYHDSITIEGETSGFEPDLDGEGSLSWTDVETESVVTGSFTLENIGDVGSRLEWLIVEYPDFGTWHCEPNEGLLTPEDDPITIEVTVMAPDKKNREFTGDLKIHVIGNPDDEVIIPVTLTTPKSNSFNVLNPWISRLIERFPILDFLLLEYS